MIQAITGTLPVDNTKFSELQTHLDHENSNPTYLNGKLSFNLPDKTLQDVTANSKKETNTKNTNSVNFKQLSEQIKATLNDKNLAIEFSFDKDSKQMILKVIDAKTNEVVQQFPTEVALKIARIVSQTLEVGNITNAKV